MTATPTGRAGMVAIGNVYAAHASQFNYSEGPDRAEIWDLTYPEMIARLAAGESITGDCSSTYEATRKDAGCINLPPLGWTGTELDTMPHIALADALEGDAIVFGAYPGLHVVWIASSHPANPKVHGNLDPSLDGHGEPGFTQDTLLELWDTVFPGQPITVLSLAPFLPKPLPDPYHYAWFDTEKVALPHGRNSERNVVENYDRLRKHLSPANAVQIGQIEENLKALAARVVNNKKGKSAAYIAEHHMDFRETWLTKRGNGDVVVK